MLTGPKAESRKPPLTTERRTRRVDEAARPPELSDPEPGVELGQPRPAHAEHGAAAQPEAGVSGRLRLDRGDPSEVDDRRAMDPAEPRRIEHLLERLHALAVEQRLAGE